MNKLVFKNYVWPQNPDKYEQKFVREPVYTKQDDGAVAFSIGPKKRTVTGSGSFFGETAYADFQNQVKVFEEDTWGALVHPVWGTCRCFFTQLEVTMEPRADYVAYRFTFLEADEDGNIPQ